MFRHYRVILRELEINTLPSCTGISNAAVGNTAYNTWNACATWQDIDCKRPEDGTIVSKHAGM
jgi:hypothetical protein